MKKKYLIAVVMVTLALVGAVSLARSLRQPGPRGSDPAKVDGPSGAPVELVVYSDFQCPACREARAPIETVRALFEGKTRLEFRHFPLEQNHRWALAAAQFAECAAEQGKFWPYHDRLYEEQPHWAKSPDAVKQFAGYARDLGLDLDRMKACVTDEAVLKRIRKQRLEGDILGVRSTPTIFINGKLIVGAAALAAQGPDLIREILEEKKTGPTGSDPSGSDPSKGV